MRVLDPHQRFIDILDDILWMILPDLTDHILDVLEVDERIIMLPELGHTICEDDDHVLRSYFGFLLLITGMFLYTQDDAFGIDLFEFVLFIAIDERRLMACG